MKKCKHCGEEHPSAIKIFLIIGWRNYKRYFINTCEVIFFATFIHKLFGNNIAAILIFTPLLTLMSDLLVQAACFHTKLWLLQRRARALLKGKP